jgi:hypothetical protein
VALIGWRLIPNRDSGVGGDPLAELKPYIAELRVPEGSKAGRHARLRDLEASGQGRRGDHRRDAGRQAALRHGTQPQAAAGDALVIEADPEALDEFRAALNLETPKASRGRGAVGDGVTLVEAVVPETRASRARRRRPWAWPGGRTPR